MRGACLIGDIGGTNARFALTDGDGPPHDIEIMPVAAFPTFAAALDAYLAGVEEPVLAAAAVAAAGPVAGGSVRLTNAPWEISEAAISARLHGVPAAVLNDLEAVALALPGLSGGEVETLAPGRPAAEPQPMLALNVGTGFGAAVAVPLPGQPDRWTALATEAGHMRLDPGPFGREEVSVEDLFSGPGYRRLFGDAAPAGAARTDYSRLLGRVAGDVVLATGSWGGLFLCGGVLSDLDRVLERGPFLTALRDKGAMAARMETLPVHHIRLDTPAFRGLQRHLATLLPKPR